MVHHHARVIIIKWSTHLLRISLVLLTWLFVREILIVQVGIENKLVSKYWILRVEIFTHWFFVYILCMILVVLSLLSSILNHLLVKYVILYLSVWLPFFNLFDINLRLSVSLHQVIILGVPNLYHHVIHHKVHMCIIAFYWLIESVWGF